MIDHDWLRDALGACCELVGAGAGLAYLWGSHEPLLVAKPSESATGMAAATCLLSLPPRWFFELHYAPRGYADFSARLKRLPRALGQTTRAEIESWTRGDRLRALIPLATRRRGLCVLLTAPGRSRLDASLTRASHWLAMAFALRTSSRATNCRETAIWGEFFAGKWSIVGTRAGENSSGIVLARSRSRTSMRAREGQVLSLALEGHSNKWIAWRVGLATATVAWHLNRAAVKLGLRSRSELLAFFGPTGTS